MIDATALSSGGRHCHKIVLKISYLGTPCIVFMFLLYICNFILFSEFFGVKKSI
jgi:hypothetical protein